MIDRASSKIVFVSSGEGGSDIEEIAKKNPNKIIKTKIDSYNSIKDEEIKKIIKPYFLTDKLKNDAFHLIKSLFKILTEKDANLM